MFETAAYVANAGLLPMLQKIADDPRNSDDDPDLNEAIASCTSGIQPQWKDFSG